ncbi:MAG: flagellar biosynthesis protein FlgD, partial [Sulfurimonadaceae bacterium]|nr:flagellar biosynthesis protein FlgD [Sulfurimonadaceae bacterium]
EDGVTKAYTVKSIENVDGEIQVKAQQILYLEDRVILQDPTDATKNQIVDYNVNGEILDENGNKTGEKIVLTAPGVPLVSDGKLTLLDENNEIVDDHKYTLAGVSVPVYSDKLTTLPFSSITKIF